MEWINIDNKKPELGKCVLVHLKSGYITVAYRTKDASGFLWQIFGDIIDYPKGDELTHWMHLPKSP